MTARVVLLGVLGASGGLLESVPSTPIVDEAAARHSRRIGNRPIHVAVGRAAQVPTSGVQAVLMHVTVRSAGRPGALWAYTPGTKKSGKPRVLLFPATGSTSSIALVRTTGRPAVELRSSAPGVRVSVDAIGYLTAH